MSLKRVFAGLISLALIFTLSACTNISEPKSTNDVQDYSINDPEIIYNSSLLSRVDSLKVGNNSAMSSLARSLAGGAFVDHIQLYTTKEPYGLEVIYKDFNSLDIRPTSDISEYSKYYQTVFSSDLAFKRTMFYDSVVVFAIVNNADFYRGRLGDKSFTLTRKQVEKYLGKKASYYMNNRSIFDTEITPLLTEGSSKLDAFLNSLSFDK